MILYTLQNLIWYKFFSLVLQGDFKHLVLLYMKIIALDVGDVWVGIAMSDGAGISCRPYITVKFNELEDKIKELLSQEDIGSVIVGHPVTTKGESSAQTKRIEKIFEDLKNKFQEIDGGKINWILWDERFSTKRAMSVIQSKSKKKRSKESTKEHAIAAAFILQSYLDSKAFHEE